VTPAGAPGSVFNRFAVMITTDLRELVVLVVMVVLM